MKFTMIGVGRNMMMLSDGENLYLIYEGSTKVYKNFDIHEMYEENINCIPSNNFGEGALDLSTQVTFDNFCGIDKGFVDIDIKARADETYVIEKEVDLKENWKKEMTVQEILDIFNQKVNSREG
ncbi:MAG: hypothetical protein ACOCRK_10490 [bacterium]